MKKQNMRVAAAASCGMLMLILDSKTAIWGAMEGIKLCLNTLIPSLFPFFLLSILLTSALTGQNFPMLRPLAAVCRLPSGTESLLAIGFLGGYPVGAKNVSLMYRNRQLTHAQAARMITICNNAGPAFIFGILGSMFSNPLIPWILWAIHILSALLLGILLPSDPVAVPVKTCQKNVRLTDALEQAVKVMAPVCGWVILMRIVLAFLDRWFLWLLPVSAQIAVCGILELSNGCVRLQEISSESMRFILAAALLSLGGICVTLQTASVTEGISMALYFPGKLLSCCISTVLSCLAAPVCFSLQTSSFPFIAAVASATGIGLIVSMHLFKKSSRNPALIGV